MEYTMLGLIEATQYEFRVFAENETGMSRPRRTAACIKTKLSGEFNEMCNVNFFCMHLVLVFSSHFTNTVHKLSSSICIYS